MKKVLSIVLALMMVLGAVACAATPTPAATTPTDAPKAEATVTEAPKAAEPASATEAPAAEPAPEPAAEVSVAPLGLLFKNKTGVTINELYVTPVGEEKGNSVVAAGWQTKDVDAANSEKFIYIVRPAGVEFEITAVYEDGTTATKTTALNMYDEISMKGVAADDWKLDTANDEDRPKIDLAVALGKTADHTYPGYVEVAAEIKNKTGKNITEFYLYEEGADPKSYNNMVDYLYTNVGDKVTAWTPGKAKEGGKYVFSYFLRPAADNYFIDLVFEDGTSMTAEIEDWFKPDGDGHQLNEISMKDAADPDVWKIAYDDGADDDLQLPMDERLAYEINVVGTTADVWYPTYGEVPAVDADALEAAKQALAHDASPLLADAAAEPAEEPAEAPAADAAAVPEGYTGLHLMLKNKSGKEIYKVYLFPTGEDKGKNIFKTVVEGNIPTEDESVEGKPHEVFAYVFRETAKLGAMTLKVRYADDTETDYELKALEDYTVFTVKADEFKQKVSDDAEDMAAMDAVAAAGVSTDGVEFAPIAAEPAAEAAVEYAALGLKFKNKYGKAFKEAYIYPVGEDKGANVLTAELPTEGEGPEDSEEVVLFIYRDAAKLDKMAVTVVTVDGEEIYWEAPSALGNNYKITVKADITDWSYDEITKEKDLNKIAEFVALGVTSDGFDPTK